MSVTGDLSSDHESERPNGEPPEAPRTGAEGKAEAKPESGTEARQNGAGKPSRPATSRGKNAPSVSVAPGEEGAGVTWNDWMERRRELLDILAEAKEIRKLGEEGRAAEKERMEKSRDFANAGAARLEKLETTAEALTRDLEQVGEEAAADVRKAGREAAKMIRGAAETASAEAKSEIERAAEEQTQRVLQEIEERLGTAVEAARETAADVEQTTGEAMKHVKQTTSKGAKKISRSAREASSGAGEIKSAAGDVRQVTWRSWAVIATVAVLLPTLIVVGLTWMRPERGLTDHQRNGMNVGTGVIEEYSRIQRRLQTSMNRIGSLKSGTWRNGSALTAADRKRLREQVMTQDSMRASLARLKEIRSVTGWTPSELTRQVNEVLKKEDLP